MSRIEGKTEKSRGLCIYIPMKSIIRETDMLSVRKISIKKLFSGIIIISITKTMLTATSISLFSFMTFKELFIYSVTVFFSLYIAASSSATTT